MARLNYNYQRLSDDGTQLNRATHAPGQGGSSGQAINVLSNWPMFNGNQGVSDIQGARDTSGAKSMAYPQAGPNRFNELLQQYYSRGLASTAGNVNNGVNASNWAQQMLDKENSDTAQRWSQARTQGIEDRNMGNSDRDFAEQQRQFNATQDNSRYALDQSNSLARDLMGQRTNAFQAMMQGGNNFRYQPLPQAQTPPWMQQGNGDMNNALIKMLLGQMGG